LLFNSLEFLVFLPTVYLLYVCMGHRRQNRMLLIASYVFYGAWDERFLFLIVLSTAVDYCAGLMIEEGRVARRARWGASLYVVLSAFALITLDWSAVAFGAGNSWLSIDWSALLSNPLGWWTLFGTLAVLTVAHLLYPRLRDLDDSRRRRLFVTLSIVTNLSILGFFKYFDFFIASAEDLAGSIGFRGDLRLNLILPVGISFYTFQTMSYTIDVYRGRTRSTREFLDFALFVAFFPQLVAGPIERARHLLPQLLKPRTLSFEQTTRGLYLILFGLFKKVAIADGVAGSVDSVFGSAGAASAPDIAAATALFAVQIYCDFSGYSDIARGTAKLLGIDVMTNFNLPYFSANPSEFWQRWHISLSSWLRDYLYIPLGGNRLGDWKTYRNLMLTMALGGLWHGAAWNFVLWGIYHGTVLCVYRWFGWGSDSEEPVRSVSSALKKLVAISFFFALTYYGWLLFRAVSFEQIAYFTETLLTGWGDGSLSMKRPTLAALSGLPLLAVYEIIEHWKGSVHFYVGFWRPIRGALYATMILVLLMGTSNEPAQFIYFQF
jgi:D-alanyl-lipoteichoic acid acyltransferase DltB (MBOAT superfamily)